MFRPRLHPRLFTRVVAVCAAGGLASAQLELPDKPVQQAAKDAKVEIAPARAGDLAKGASGAAQKNDGVDRSGATVRLDLPNSAPPAQAPAKTVPQVAAADTGAAAVEQAPLPTTAAMFVLGEVRRVKELDDTLIQRAVESLLRMGPAGRDAALTALAEDHAALVMVGARTLLQGGRAEDCERVQQRLRERLPGTVCAPLVDALVQIDPVHASPQFLAELLGHRQAAVRNASQRHLDALGANLPIDALAPLLGAKESDGRLRAVQLLAKLPDPNVIPLLLDRLGDPSAAVARRAVDALASRDDERLDAELAGRAFAERWILREQCYALLTLIEREDLHLTPVLSEVHAAALLDGLASKDAFISGTCAAALAGVGFRSATPGGSTWLDLEVPHKLVSVVAADVFSSDYSSLAGTAARRLALLSGGTFGSDGPAWREWWRTEASSFRARRAVLATRDEDMPTLRVALMSNTSTPEAFCLLGPGLIDAAGAPTAGKTLHGETLFLSEIQARTLFDLLRKQFVFDQRRLPGTRGSSDAAGSSLTVEVAGREKSFRFAGVTQEDWFVSALEAARALRERNRWQRYPDSKLFASPQDYWRAQFAWWDEPHSDADRGRRLADAVLVFLAQSATSERDRGVDELARLERDLGTLTMHDFAPLIALLGGEHFLGPRARTLLDLAIASGRRASEPPGAPLGDDFARDLVTALVETFDAAAAEQVARVFDAAGREATRRYAADPSPFLRAVAAAALARQPDADDLAVLMRLLDDPVDAVQAAAVLALGENKVEAARTPLLVRARVAPTVVRVKALTAVGMMGGVDALDALLGGLSEHGEPAIYVAAARGLALLHDPQTSPLLITLLAKGNQDPAFDSARRGLSELGEAAWSDLLRVVHSPNHRAQRDAALILSEQGVPQAASALITWLTDHRDDSRVAGELAVLTCVDLRGESDPAVAWWNWWEGVVHDDSRAWFCAALARAGIAAPAPEAFDGGGREALQSLIDVLQRDEAYLVERARRELARILARDTGPVPPVGPERTSWITALREAIDARAK